MPATHVRTNKELTSHTRRKSQSRSPPRDQHQFRTFLPTNRQDSRSPAARSFRRRSRSRSPQFCRRDSRSPAPPFRRRSRSRSPHCTRMSQPSRYRIDTQSGKLSNMANNRISSSQTSSSQQRHLPFQYSHSSSFHSDDDDIKRGHKISQLNTPYEVMLQDRYRRLITGYSEAAFRWLGNFLDTLREHRTSFDRTCRNSDKVAANLKWAWQFLIYSGIYQTLITLPIQEESGRPNSPMASSIYLALSYNRLVDHLHWSLESLTPVDALFNPEQAELLCRVEWIAQLTYALGNLRTPKYKPCAEDRLFLFHESRNSLPAAGRSLPISWYYTAYLSTLVSGYHICSEIGRTWSEVTEDSTAAQIDDICVSLTPLLRDYTSWDQDVRGDSALWYPYSMNFTFPYFETEIYLISAIEDMVTLRAICNAWGKEPFKNQGHFLTEFKADMEAAAHPIFLDLEIDRHWLALIAYPTGSNIPSETRTLSITAARTQSMAPSLTSPTARVMNPPVATIGVPKPAPRIMSPKITALSPPPPTHQRKAVNTTSSATEATTQYPTAPIPLPKIVEALSKSVAAPITTCPVRTTQVSVVDARYGEPDDESESSPPSRSSSASSARSSSSTSSSSRSQSPDPDNEPQPTPTELNTPLLSHLTKFAQACVTQQLNSLTETNATLATSLAAMTQMILQSSTKADDRVTKLAQLVVDRGEQFDKKIQDQLNNLTERLDKRMDENSRNTDSAIKHMTTEMIGHVNQTLGHMTQDLVTVTANHAAEIASTSLAEHGQHREPQPPALTPSARLTPRMVQAAVPDDRQQRRCQPSNTTPPSEEDDDHYASILQSPRTRCRHVLSCPSRPPKHVTYYHDPHDHYDESEGNHHDPLTTHTHESPSDLSTRPQVRILHNPRSNVIPDHHSHGQHLDVVQPSQNRSPQNPKLNVIPDPESLQTQPGISHNQIGTAAAPIISTLAKTTDNHLVELLEWDINYLSRWPPQMQSNRAMTKNYNRQSKIWERTATEVFKNGRRQTICLPTDANLVNHAKASMHSPKLVLPDNRDDGREQPRERRNYQPSGTFDIHSRRIKATFQFRNRSGLIKSSSLTTVIDSGSRTHLWSLT
eukprot:gene1777-3439_t